MERSIGETANLLLKKNKRTEFEICKTIFETLFQNNPIHKSDLRELTGLGQRSINKWVNLIAFIQSQPNMEITNVGRQQMLKLEKPAFDGKIFPETIEALKAMKQLLELPSNELKKKLEALC